MYCRKCGKEINNDVAFCPYCGEAAATGSASNKPLGEKKTIEKTNASNGTKKTLIFVGTAIIVVLLTIILILVNGGKNKENDNVDTSNVTGEKAVEDSILSEIVGEWRQCGRVGGGAHADLYETPTYLRIESEGLMGIGAAEEFDVDTGEVEGENVFYQIGTRKINVYEENGVKYYEYSAEIYTGVPGNGKNDISIRLYFNETENILVCEYNVPEDGFWQKHAKYERIDSIQGDREDRLSSNSTNESEDNSESTGHKQQQPDESIPEYVPGVYDADDGMTFITLDPYGWGTYGYTDSSGSLESMSPFSYYGEGDELVLNINGGELRCVLNGTAPVIEYNGLTFVQTESVMEKEQNNNSSNDNAIEPMEVLTCGAWKSQTSEECYFSLDGMADEIGYGVYQKNNSQGWEITYTIDGQKIFLNIDGIETEFYYDLENDIMIRDADGEVFTRF